MGFVNFYRRFIHHYSQIAGPLTGLLKSSQKGIKSGPFKWPKAANQAFRWLTDAFNKAPLLKHFDPQLSIRIKIDASEYALASILSQLQEDNKQWHSVAFHSRKMIPAERNYETYDQELLAIVTAFKQWRHYLKGSFYPVEVLTDYNNLKYFMRLAQLNGRQAQWAIKLSIFDFFITHRLGKTNPADAPSRQPDYWGENKSLSQLLPTLQHKLTMIGSLASPILAAIQTAYGQGNRYPFEGYSAAIHSLGASEHQDAGGQKETDVHRITLIGSMAAAC